MKNFNDTVENRTRDLPACSVMPETTVPPPTPEIILFQVGSTLSQATKALRESTGIALLYFRPLH